ncbi:MAG: hypothetical protein ACOZDD_07085 [Bacteroidota bacterium]
MKTLKYILFFILAMGLSNSCLIEDETNLDLNGKGPNLGGFEQARTTFAAIADGEQYQFDVKVKVFGPTWMDITSDVTLTIAADPSSTAKAGTHYRIDNPTITLSPSKNMLGLFKVTMLTEGIETPLAVAPVLVLRVTQASGAENVLNSGKPISITFNYACPSFLEGTYQVSTEYTATTGAVSMLSWTETITKIGIGTYRTTRVGHWTPDALGGTPGFTFTDVCGVISVPSQNLVDLYANIVEGTAFGTADEDTGKLYIEYSVCYGGACRFYKSTYTRQ